MDVAIYSCTYLVFIFSYNYIGEKSIMKYIWELATRNKTFKWMVKKWFLLCGKIHSGDIADLDTSSAQLFWLYELPLD